MQLHLLDRFCARMNAQADVGSMSSGGKQLKMHDTVWNGQPQSLTLPDGTPKGAALILQERGYDTGRMKLEEMRRILEEHDDFKSR